MRYSRIGSDNEKVDPRYINLEKWLLERGHRERMDKTYILKARSESRDSLLVRGNTRTSKRKLTFNITYSPAFQDGRGIFQDLQVLLALNKEHKKVFPEVPIVG